MTAHGKHFVLHCLQCQTEYSPYEVSYFCPKCELNGALDVVYDYEEIGKRFRKEVSTRNDFDMWRYQCVLPNQPDRVPRLHTGGSPLYRLMHSSGQVFIKDDSRNPSGSLKDRASAMAVALATGEGVRTIAAASTGNAAAALACMSVGSGMRCAIFVPNNASPEKLAQIRAYGAEVIEVVGGYDEAFAACHDACKENGWYNRSTGINSYMSEGKKTVAFEICEQMGWQIPDRVFVPVGNGCIVGSVYKGFRELQQMGCIDHLPRIMGVQASGSDFMYRAWRSGDGVQDTVPVPACTSASSIAVALPRERIKAMRAIEESGGAFITVSDGEIFASLVGLARTAGVFAEPGAAAAYAGALSWGAMDSREVSVVLITGSGMKDISCLIRSGVLATDETAPQGTPCSAGSGMLFI
jgi:threonine synthase